MRPTSGGLVYGSLEAARYFKEHDQAGTIINVESILSNRALVPQGIYSASKHAVKVFADALRMGVEIDHILISVTHIQPGAIATPYSQHAKNYMKTERTIRRPSTHLKRRPRRFCTVPRTESAMSTSGRVGKALL